MKNTKNVIWSIHSWSPFFILRMFAAYGSRVQFSPNSLLNFFLLGCPPLFINRHVHRFATRYFWLFNVCLSVCVRLYLLMDQLSSTERIFIKFYIWIFFENLNFLKNMTKITCSLQENSFIFMLSYWVLLRVRSV